MVSAPVVPPPDFFFTYMSHWAPRLIENSAGVTFVNSMHGVRLLERRRGSCGASFAGDEPVTMFGGEVYGRSYGGGVLKMEPREAAALPVPSRRLIEKAWRRLRAEKHELDHALRVGEWIRVMERVDQVLLVEAAGLARTEVATLRESASALRRARIGTD